MKRELVNETIKYSYIIKHPLFKQLDDEHFKEICFKARLIKLKKNNPFLLRNDPVSRIYFLGGGTAKLISFNNSGKNSVTDILVDGEIFGDFSFTSFNTNGYVTGLTANTYMFYFVATEFKKMLQQNHVLSLNFAETIGSKLRQLETRHSIWTNRDARQRLLYFFQGWSACGGTRLDDKVILDNYFALSDIADFIGVTRQFMHIMMKELKAEGHVFYSRKQIIISNVFLGSDLDKQKLVV